MSKPNCEIFFQSSQNLLGVLSPDLTFSAANPAFGRLFGIENGNLIGRSSLDFFHPDEQESVRKALLGVLSKEDGNRFGREFRLRNAKGQYLWVECQFWLVAKDDLIYFVGVNRSETKRDRTFLAEIQKCAKIGGWEIDLPTRKVFWSDETHEIHGTDRETHEPTLEKAYDLYAPEYREKIIELVEMGLKEHRGWTLDAYVIRHGQRVPVRVISKVDLRDGKLTRLYGTFQDVSEQKQVEEELIERERRLNLVIEAGHIGFNTWDMLTDEVTLSERLSEMLGLEYTGLKQPLSDWLNLIHPDDLPEYLVQLNLVRTQNSKLYRKNFRVRHSSGRWLQLLSQGKAVAHGPDGSPEEFIGILTDVTAETENQLRIADQIQKSIVAQKLAALGEMAAGIAHEINNPLTVIGGRASTLLRKINSGTVDSDYVRQNLSLIEETSFRIAEIISGLTHFAHESEQMPQSEEVFRTILDNTLVFCSERLKKNGVELIIDDQSADTRIRCSPLQISQVLLNLFNNSYDAVQRGEEKWVRVSARILPSRILEVAVSDSGQRIDAETQSKMMNPFFSTKEVGKGTGLGLSVSKGIIERHGGRFFYRAESPNTCFVFELPVLN